MIKYGSTALGHNREKQIALPLVKEEFALGEGKRILQLNGSSKFSFPHAVDHHQPFVSRRLYDHT
jgi:hypothetical protein